MKKRNLLLRLLQFQSGWTKALVRHIVNYVNRKLTRQIAESFILTAIADGQLDPRGKTQEQFARKIVAYLKPAADGSAPLGLTADHRSRLLRQAQLYRKAGRYEEAVLYYATWIEHMLNMLMASAFRRQSFPQDTIRRFIRGTSVVAKYIFVVQHFCGKAPSHDRLAKLDVLEQRRNQFVHFKWLYYEEKTLRKLDAEYARIATDAERLVSHLG